MFKMILFDFDGTLADSFGWFQRTLNECAVRYHFNPVADEDTEHFRRSDTRTILLKLGLSWWKRPLVARQMRLRMNQDASQISLFPGVREILNELSRSYQLGIVSSNSHENISLILGQDLQCFTHLECGVSLFGKAARIKKLIKVAGLTSDEVLYIGDETRDYEAANTAGISFAPVLWGYAHEETLLALPHVMCFKAVKDLRKLKGPGKAAPGN